MTDQALVDGDARERRGEALAGGTQIVQRIAGEAVEIALGHQPAMAHHDHRIDTRVTAVANRLKTVSRAFASTPSAAGEEIVQPSPMFSGVTETLSGSKWSVRSTAATHAARRLQDQGGHHGGQFVIAWRIRVGPRAAKSFA